VADFQFYTYAKARRHHPQPARRHRFPDLRRQGSPACSRAATKPARRSWPIPWPGASPSRSVACGSPQCPA